MKLIASFCIILYFTQTLFGQSIMEIDSTLSPNDLVQQILLNGEDLKVGNIKYTGSIDAIGAFKLSNKDMLGFDGGLVLSTGKATSATGPNSSPQRTDELKTKGDDDLTALCNNKTHDAAIWEFDFVPMSNRVSFEYIFASDEYPEYTGSEYNDVFAFFISGPAIDGKKNMATLEKNGEIVAINTINKYRNNEYYIRNNAWKLDGKIKSDGALSRMNKDMLNSFEFDGMTTVLTASTNVIPYKKYHFKIAIADVKDKKYNSAVFLKGGTFKITEDADAKGVFSVQPKVNKDKVDFDAILNDKPFDINVAVSESKEKTKPNDTAQQVEVEEKPKNTKKTKEVVIDQTPKEEKVVPKEKTIVEKETTESIKSNPVDKVEREKIQAAKPVKLMMPADFESVYFATASDVLNEYSQRMLLYNLIPSLEITPEAEIFLSGHTDAVGDGVSNLSLSENRVNIVAEFLIKNGIDSKRITTTYHASALPAASNAYERGRSRNRRVDIRFEKMKSLTDASTPTNTKPPKILGSNPPFKIEEEVYEGNDDYLKDVPQLVYPSKFESVYFEVNSAEFSLHAEQMLEIFVAMLKKTPEAYVELVGHRDARETDASIDEKRTKAISDFFIKNGIAETSFFVSNYDSKQPASSSSSKGRKLNRRVEIIISKKE